MSKVKELKQILKALAEKIRETKIALKEHQRKNAGWDGGFYLDVHKLAWEFRHKHIAYCLLRGRTRDEIERPGDDNLPDETLIQEAFDAYRTENVRACA